MPSIQRDLIAVMFIVISGFLTTTSMLLSLGAAIGPVSVVVSVGIGTYCADVLSAIIHFSFDYIIPDRFPILGSVAQSFRRHHVSPVLDPTMKISNFAIGSSASFPLALLSLSILFYTGETYLGSMASLIVAVMSLWGLLFHQIHSYAHMGAHVDPDLFQSRIEVILNSGTDRDQRRRLNMIFDELPIPKFVRMLQRMGLILDPVRHVGHHTDVDCNFSSVNGWSDGLMNPLLRRLARRSHFYSASTMET